MKYELKNIGEVARFFNNQRKPVTKLDRSAGPYPYFGAAGIQDYVSDFLFDGDYVLVGEDGTVLTDSDTPVLQRVMGKFWANNHAHVINCINPSDTDYLYYALKQQNIREFVTGAVQLKLNMGNLKSICLPWPNSEKVRNAISSHLRMLDEKIRLNDKIVSNLEQMAQAIFKSWFIDFDPVHAKAAGEKPFGMDDETAALFPDSFEESELGDIPAGWTFKKAIEIFSFSIGRTPPRKESEWFSVPPEGVPWVSIKDMGSYEVFTGETSETLTEKAIVKHRVPVVEVGTVLMSFKLTLGRLAIAIDKVATNEAIAHFRPNRILSSEYTYLALSNLNLDDLDSTSSIATATNSSAIKSIQFLVPDKLVLDRFNLLVKPLFDQILTLQMQNSTLKQLRDSLLPRLISGELEIPEELLS